MGSHHSNPTASSRNPARSWSTSHSGTRISVNQQRRNSNNHRQGKQTDPTLLVAAITAKKRKQTTTTTTTTSRDKTCASNNEHIKRCNGNIKGLLLGSLADRKASQTAAGPASVTSPSGSSTCSQLSPSAGRPQPKRSSLSLLCSNNDNHNHNNNKNANETSEMQASNMSSTTTTTTCHQPDRRRDSLAPHDVGDVFIYPPNYRHLNECQKCSRDVKICNCNVADQLGGPLCEESSSEESLSDSRASTSTSLASCSVADQSGQVSSSRNASSGVKEFDEQQRDKRMVNIPGEAGDSGQKKADVATPADDSPQLGRAASCTCGAHSEPALDTPTTADSLGYHCCCSCRSPLRRLCGQSGQGGHGGRPANNNNQLQVATADEHQHQQPGAAGSFRSRALSAPFQRMGALTSWSSSSTRSLTTITTTIASSSSQLEVTGSNYKLTQLKQQQQQVVATLKSSLQAQTQACDSDRGEGPTPSACLPLSVSARRQNLCRSRLLNVCDDSTVATDTGSQCLVKCIDLKPSLDSLDQADQSKESAEARSELEYSPILTSVLDYIENINPELKLLQQAQVASGLVAATPASCSAGLQIALSSTPIKTSGAGNNHNNNQLQLVDIKPSNLIVETSSAAGLIATATSTGSQVAQEAPMRSIFDGASKDEILEYLEDARERVPEVLIAADDVMVINESQMIVVNQLEPNGPATPISIMEASEVAAVGALKQLNGDVVGGADSAADEHQQVETTTTNSTTTTTTSELHQQFAMVAAKHNSASRTSSRFDSIDGSSLITVNSTSSQVFTSSSQAGSPQPTSGQATTSSNLNRFSCMTAVTLDSMDYQLGEVELADEANELGQDEQPPLEAPDRNSKQDTRQPLGATQSNSSNDGLEFANGGSRRHSRRGLGQYVEQQAAERSPFLSSASGRRRKSTSETSPGAKEHPTTPSGHAGHLQMMLLHHHQQANTRDSLSSSSMSPPSSGSPSSSSNQTSGNCSGASNFYASSSLSCSSPYLATLSVAPTASTIATSGETAFNKSPAGLVIVTSSPSCSSTTLKSSPGLEGPDKQQQEQQVSSSVVERGDSGLGSEIGGPVKFCPPVAASTRTSEFLTLKQVTNGTNSSDSNQAAAIAASGQRLSVIKEIAQQHQEHVEMVRVQKQQQHQSFANNKAFSSPPNAGLMARPLHSHYATMNRLTNHMMINRATSGDDNNNTDWAQTNLIEFQCLDCDQFIQVDQATIAGKFQEIRMLREHDLTLESIKDKPMSPDQLERAYTVAMNGLPLCKSCEKRRRERKDIISEFVDTELKYGRDLKIIHDEFYRPMQIAGLLNKDQINGIFLNLEELIMAHCRFADRLEVAVNEALAIRDNDYNSVNIGKLFVESADMLHTYESYCVRQGSAACLLARLAKEKELLRIFLRVSQMENTLLRRMNLAAFLMVPVQRVTKYPLLLNRLYKVTPYHHKDREALRDAQLKVELHLEHINQQTKGISATNKIWRRIYSLSAPIPSRRGMINAEDIGYIKLRKSAMDILKWDRDETQFIHSGKINFAPLNEFLIKQKMKPLRYIAAHALLIVLGKPNWKYRPDLVKSNLDSKLMTPTPGGNGIKEAALLLFREKNGRFVACREPLFLSNCVMCNDCSQFNSECPPCSTSSTSTSAATTTSTSSPSSTSSFSSSSTNVHHGGDAANFSLVDRKSLPSNVNATCGGGGGGDKNKATAVATTNSQTEFRAASAECQRPRGAKDKHQNEHPSVELVAKNTLAAVKDARSINFDDSISMSSLKSLPDDKSVAPPGPLQTARSYSLASALPRTPIATGQAVHLTKATSGTSSNLTIINQLMTKVNSYHQSKQNGGQVRPAGGANDKTVTAPGQASLSRQQTSSATSLNELTKTNVKPPTTNQQAGEPANQLHYNHHYFHHHQPYGDYEESFEIHERLSKESLLLRADTLLKTRYWLQMLRYHAKDLGQWRARRNALANIMMMRHDC